MARYLGPVCKRARREGSDLEYKTRDIETKCKLDKVPGQHGDKRSRLSDYGLQLRMKARIKRYYDVLEKPFRNYYKKADRMKGATGENLLLLLESRLDNVVFRMGFAATRRESRQLVSHGAIRVNGCRVTVASFQVSPNDVVSIADKAKGQMRISHALELRAQRSEFGWLQVDGKKLSGVFKTTPKADEFPTEFKVNLVVELYSK